MSAFVPCQNLIQLIGSIEYEFSEIYLTHRSHKRDQIITFIKNILTKSHASCECFTLTLHIYVPILLQDVLLENNEHIITSNGRRNRKL